MPDLTTYAQLGGTVVTVLLFLNYLTKRDNKWTDSLKDNVQANILLAKALQRLTDMVERNSSMSIANTSKIIENVSAVKENTESVKENSGVIKKTNGKQ